MMLETVDGFLDNQLGEIYYAIGFVTSVLKRDLVTVSAQSEVEVVGT